MTPKEKAKEILEKVNPHSQYWDCYNDVPLEENHSLKIALICVDEVVSQWEYIDTYLADLNGELNPNLKYWHEVKKELSLLYLTTL